MSNPAVAGYAAGSAGIVTTVDKFAFPAETRTTLGTGLSGGRGYAGGVSYHGTAGYVCGGYNGSNVNVIDKFAWPSDTRTTLGATLSSSRRVPGPFER
jgi:hypothetical protein